MVQLAESTSDSIEPAFSTDFHLCVWDLRTMRLTVEVMLAKQYSMDPNLVRSQPRLICDLAVGCHGRDAINTAGTATGYWDLHFGKHELGSRYFGMYGALSPQVGSHR